MQTKSKITQKRKTLYGIMLLAVFLSAFGTGRLPFAHAQGSIIETPIKIVAPTETPVPGEVSDGKTAPTNTTMEVISLSATCDIQVYYGVQHCTDGAGTHYISIDLNDSHVRFQTVLSSGSNGECNSVNHSGKDPGSNCPNPYPFERMSSLLSRYKSQGAVAAINTDYFGTNGDHGAQGLAVRNGSRLDGPAHGVGNDLGYNQPSLAISPSKSITIGIPGSQNEIDSNLNNKYYNTVGGAPIIVSGGQAVNTNCTYPYPGSTCSSTAQSAAGITSDGRLILLTGAKNASSMASYLISNFGVHTAIKFDGGGSARIAWLDSGENVQSWGVTGEDRAVAEGLLVFSTKIGVPPPQCNPNSDQVALFADANYSGNCVVKGIGDYPNPGSIGISNDSVTSIKVGGNVKLTICQHDNYAGTCETFQGDAANLGNNSIGDNQVSSAKVESRPTGGSCTNGATLGSLQPGYSSCANEGGTCTFSGQASVAYGANNCFFYQTFTGSVACNNNTFGDPIAGTGKACYSKILTSPPSANFDAWPESGMAPFTTAFHIVNMSNITNCSWNYGDGQTSTTCTQLHDHIYNNLGSYTVSLTVSGPGGSDSKTKAGYINVTGNGGGTGLGCDQVSYTGVTLYEQANCNRDTGGATKAFSSPTGWIDVVSDFNDIASSIYVTPGWSIKVYEAATFDFYNGVYGGSWRCITGNMWDLGLDYYTNINTSQVINDTISSIQVYNNSSCNSSGTSTFGDVPPDHPLYAYIQALYDGGYTAGCSTSPLMFCPDTILDRAQSAVFMLRGAKGSTYAPPAAPWYTFLSESWFGFEWAQGWAEGMYQEGLTQGCQTNPLKFCPANQLPRVEASIFGLKMKYGVTYLPPPATGTLFADFPSTDPSYWGIAWAEKAYVDGLLPACGTDTVSGKPMFCPGELVNRGWGAYLIVKAKGLPTQ